MIKEELNFKTTEKKPITSQSKNFENNFKKTMVRHGVNLNEVDGLLTEKEQSLKKKIFKLNKMEGLVFSDPKLSTIYNDMAENGEERYGYHYNETIMNILFNDYVLNSSRYLQKYKQAIPKEKKRRDKGGINQLKLAGEKKMRKDNVSEYVDQIDQPNYNEDCFIESTGGVYNVSCNGKYLDEYDEINLALDAIKRWKIDNNYSPNIWFISDHGNISLIDDEGNFVNSLDETTSAGSAGGSAGYVGYAGPAAWSKSGKPMSKPIFMGGTVIGESNYIINPNEFKKYYNGLNEQTDVDYIQKNSEAYGSLNNMNKNDIDIIKSDIESKEISEIRVDFKDRVNYQTQSAIKPDNKDCFIKAANNSNFIAFCWGEDMGNFNDIGTAIDAIEDRQRNAKNYPNIWFISDSGNYSLMTTAQGALNEKAKSKAQQKFMGMVHAVQSGQLSPNKVSDKVLKAVKTMKKTDVIDFASTKHEKLPEKINEVKEISSIEIYNDEIANGKSEEDAAKFVLDIMTNGLWAMWDNDKINEFVDKIILAANNENNLINEESQTMIADNPSSISVKTTPNDNSNMERGMNMNENNEYIENVIKDFDAICENHNNLKNINEDRKPSTLVMKDRLGSQNKSNFKQDLQHSGTKEIINIEKELQWKDQQIDIGKDPQKLASDIEKEVLKRTKGNALKNVGNSANKRGNEIPKRNLTDDEMDEVNKYRLGMEDLVYDNEPSEKFKDRMKADMGEKIYKQGEIKKEFRSKAPMYNKDTQPIENGIKKVQFNKDKSGWNEREGIDESTIITGKYVDLLGKKRLINFNFGNVNESISDDEEGVFQLDFTGLGNAINNKGEINKNIANVLSDHSFFTNGFDVYVKKGKQIVSEAVDAKKFDEMMHLLSYKPNNFINTKSIKNNRGF